MKIKFNWGTGIFSVIVLFILLVIAFFIFINNLDINLVEDNYYEKELVFQDRIEKIENTSSLSGKIRVIAEPGIVSIQFPRADTAFIPEGNILFYRPSDPKKDFTVPLQLNDSSRQAINVSGVDKGRWVVKIDWKMGEREYYYEEAIIILH